MGQNHPPLNEIPVAPESATAGNIISRMVQGLGYRYYWASKDLRIEDLSYRPSEEGASTFETLEHIYGLAEIIRNTATSSPTIRPLKSPPKIILFSEKNLSLPRTSQRTLCKQNSKRNRADAGDISTGQ